MKKHRALKVILLILTVPLVMVVAFLGYHKIALWIEVQTYPPWELW